MKNILHFLLFFAMGLISYAQTTVSGTVLDDSNNPIPSANVLVINSSNGTATDSDGEFLLEHYEETFTIEVSSVGFKTETVTVTESLQDLVISLQEGTFLDEVVVSASRTPERLFESPVTVELMDPKAITNTTSPSFYGGLENLKGVDVNTNSLTFKSVNTRGFASFSNTRFMQLVDGMDNAAPGLNFAIGNLLGLSELDIKSVELLPGAASALYGANAFNGLMFMSSKDPFKEPGISVYVKPGLTAQESAGNNQFIDAGFRVAKAFSDKFAAKATVSFLKGTEWQAADDKQYEDAGSGVADEIISTAGATVFDKANIYGDEVSLGAGGTNLNEVAQTLVSLGAMSAQASGLVPEADVSRTGYKETDLNDNVAESIKADIALHYRPYGDKDPNNLELSYNGKIGTGNTVYQGANRYSIKNFIMQQHKLEVKTNNFSARAYMTEEDAGDSYDMKFAGINLNMQTKDSWFGTYAGAYAQGAADIISAGGDHTTAASVAALHAGARQYADNTVTLQPGTEAFDTALAGVTSDPDLSTGAKFQDNSKYYHTDFNYNLKDVIDFAEIQVGASWRQYSLNSKGTIFTDYDAPIDYKEYGAYTQLQKKLVDDRLKFTGSIRYDKAQNFDASLSPRASLVYALDEDKKHNVRVSYQTGFRNPTAQDQYIGLDVGIAHLVGSSPDNIDKYTTDSIFYNSEIMKAALGSKGTIVNGSKAYSNSFTVTSLREFGAAVEAAVPGIVGNVAYGSPDLAGAKTIAAGLKAGLIKVADISYVKPEEVTSLEFGYRGMIKKVTLDFSAYYNKYKDFIGNKTVAVPLYGDTSGYKPLEAATDSNTQMLLGAIGSEDYVAFQTYTNSKADITSYGAAIGLSTKILGGYDLGLNYTYAKFDFDQASDPDYEAGFNTPEHKVKVAFGNTNIYNNLGFNVNLRWNDEYLWEATFIDAIIESRTTVDAQISYNVPSINSKFKLGATNIGGKEYLSAPGSGMIGSQYYLSCTINP